MTATCRTTLPMIVLATLVTAREAAIADTTVGGAYASAVRAKDDRAIAEACGRAAAASPAPAFLLWAGVARVELVWAKALETEARRRGRSIDEATVPTSTDFSEARAYLDRAVAAEPRLWRAHYYLGRIHRTGGDDRAAAESFTRAIAANPEFGALYIALAGTYQRWGYTDLVIQVAATGTEHVSDRRWRSKLWQTLASARHDRGLPERALLDVERALTEDPNNQRARFMRGQWLLAAGKLAAAKADLEATVNDPPSAFAKEVAQHLLQRLASEAAP